MIEVVVWQLVSMGMYGLAVVLVGYGKYDNKLREGFSVFVREDASLKVFRGECL